VKICAVLPIYNESKTIAKLIKQIKLQGLEVLVVDDGSSDNSFAIARESGAVVLENPMNMGKGVSLVRGFEYSLANNFDAVITLDGDGQHNPEDIPHFVRAAESSDSGIFIGNRMFKTNNMPVLRFLTNRFMSWLISIICKQRIPDTQCGFRLIKKEVLQKVSFRTKNFEAESEILIKAARLGFKIESVPINTIYMGEKSRINPFLDTFRFMKFFLGEIWK